MWRIVAKHAAGFDERVSVTHVTKGAIVARIR